MESPEIVRVRRKDTTKGPPLRILSLDGGGVRGYSMLIILQELMHRTFVEIEGRAPKRHEIPKPCEHFDLIAGTGTGGLIAIMLGRLRLDIDTCKDVYVRMTRRVFETDKTFAGIPYRSTLFKASKLEEAIRECVREHTVFEDEGNDTLANATPMSPETPGSAGTGSSGVPQRSMSQTSRYSQVGMSPMGGGRPMFGSMRFGNPNALLYDTREHRTKTAVTALYKGTPRDAPAAFLRSYDSRKEPAPDVNCKIWEAGRATCATGMAFKPIQVGQSVYIDEGPGRYNPAPQVLDEAAQNEWPGREVGVFVSVGTGKPPQRTGSQQPEWWESFLGDNMGSFAEARRRLASKIEGCEGTHQYMKREHLGSRGVNAENYYRLNAEVGVGDFGMNEWNRLSDISTNTRMYLGRKDVEAINLGASAKLAKIHFAKARYERAETRRAAGTDGPQYQNPTNPWDRPLPAAPPPSNPMAVELPGDDMYLQTESFRPGSQLSNNANSGRYSYEHRPSVVDQKYVVVGEDHAPDPPQTPPQQPAYPQQQQQTRPYSPSSPSHYLSRSHGTQNSSNSIPPLQPHSPRHSVDSYQQQPTSPPPLPPKTPLPYPDDDAYGGAPHPADGNGGPRTFTHMGSLGRRLPYPDVEGPPPAVNVGSKPTMTR
ncbi:hypothetical protein MBLNU230_g7156t1 [Neophaeotheca triangularis]